MLNHLVSLVILLGAFVPIALAGSCKNNQFWWEASSSCLPVAGPSSSPPPPPSGHSCPSLWYWAPSQGSQGSCVPTHPNPPPPTCPPGWSWLDNCCKNPPPQPSNKWNGWKRSLQSEAGTLCPSGLEACPIPGLMTTDYECIDTTVELESCGGCVSTRRGVDCTALHGVWNVGCEYGSCEVYSCMGGYALAHDRKSCIIS